ncbi:MAG: haloacid dehalogenase [Thermoprotei archaeon]|nr:MAG: haloacid dehalogenase [Thermoprotei archaeon]
MQEIKDEIKSVISLIDSFLKEKDNVREDVIKKTRDIIREAGYAITDIHRGDISLAELRIKNLRVKVTELLNQLRNHPELMYSNLLYNALAEYAEAEIFYAIVVNNKLPTPNELNIHPTPYLQGLLDVVGEIKRYTLSLLKNRDIEKAWRYFSIIETIYEVTKPLDYPDALVPGLKRKVDVARAVVENLRAFLIDIQSRLELINELKIRSNS